MPEAHRRYIEGWRDKCVGYEFVMLNENNFDVSAYPYARDAYKNGNWSYVSDVARMVALRDMGGVYLDTDVELLHPLDSLLGLSAFVHETGVGCLNSAFMGCEEGGLPDLLQRTFDAMQPGKVIFTEMTRIAYELYPDMLGGERDTHNGVTVLGLPYVANPTSGVCQKTIAVHHEAQSWTGGWLGGFRPMEDMVPVNEEGSDVTMTAAKGSKLTTQLLEKANLFKNTRVVRVTTLDGDVFERRGRSGKRILSAVAEDGSVVDYEAAVG